jgi:hypothetical protein
MGIASAQVVASALCLLFVSACLGKLDGWRAWRRSVSTLLAQPTTIRAAAFGVPAIEAIISALLILRPRVGLASAGLLLALLGIAVLILSRRHAGIACNCFGALAPSTITRSLGLRDLGLATMAGVTLALAPADAGSALPTGQVLALLAFGLLILVAAEAVKLRAVIEHNFQEGPPA